MVICFSTKEFNNVFHLSDIHHLNYTILINKLMEMNRTLDIFTTFCSIQSLFINRKTKIDSRTKFLSKFSYKNEFSIRIRWKWCHLPGKRGSFLYYFSCYAYSRNLHHGNVGATNKPTLFKYIHNSQCIRIY